MCLPDFSSVRRTGSKQHHGNRAEIRLWAPDRKQRSKTQHTKHDRSPVLEAPKWLWWEKGCWWGAFISPPIHDVIFASAFGIWDKWCQFLWCLEHARLLLLSLLRISLVLFDATRSIKWVKTLCHAMHAGRSMNHDRGYRAMQLVGWNRACYRDYNGNLGLKHVAGAGLGLCAF